jgi:DNA-binding HxlR family transcriptional regulator
MKRSFNKECSISRAMEVVGDRWSILLLREAYYGTRRFDEFQYYLGVAPNILSARLKKFVDLGMMTRVPLPEHGGRYEYVLTKKGRDFFPTYLALKKWGDDWLAEPEGPQVVFRGSQQRAANRVSHLAVGARQAAGTRRHRNCCGLRRRAFQPKAIWRSAPARKGQARSRGSSSAQTRSR